MALKNANIAKANPGAVANSSFINALYVELRGNGATSAELKKFSGKSVKDAANLILGKGSPFVSAAPTAGINLPAAPVTTPPSGAAPQPPASATPVPAAVPSVPAPSGNGAKATLVNPTTGDRQAISVGSQQESDLMKKGYVLETTPPTETSPGQAVTKVADINGAKLRAGVEAQGFTYLGTMDAVKSAIQAGKTVTQVGNNYYFKNKPGVQSSTPTPSTPDTTPVVGGPAAAPSTLSPDLTPAWQRIQDQITNGEISDPRDLLMGPGSTAPTAPNLIQTYDDLRKQLGMDQSEEQLAAADDALQKLDDSYRAGVAEQNQGLAPMGIIEGRQKKLYDQYQLQRSQLAEERDSVARRLDQKNTTISTMMTLTQQDYSNARQDYSDKFNQTLQVNQMVQQNQNDAFNQWIAARQDARAQTEEGRAQLKFEFDLQQAEKTEAQSNLQVIYNSISAGSITYSALPKSTKDAIASLELKSGFPPGIIQKLQSTDPNKNIISTSARTDPSGMKFADIVMRDAKGNLTVKTISLGKEYIAPTSAQNISETEFMQQATSLVGKSLQKVVGGDGKVSPDDYKSARSQWVQQGFSSKDFDERFATFVNTSYPTYWKDYGLTQPSLP